MMLPRWQRPLALVLAGGVVMGLALGVRHVQGLFMLPVTMERGWSRETFGLALALQNLTWGLAQPFTGMVADRWGSARVICAGLLLYALGLWGMVQANTPAGFVWAAGVCIGLALSGTAFAAVYGALSRLVPADRRGWALGLAGAMGGFAQFALVPLTPTLIQLGSWQTALLCMAGAMLLALPLAALLRDQAGQHSQVTQHTQATPPSLPLRAALRQAFGHRGFWLLNAGFLACGFQLAFIATHLPAYLLDRGLGPAQGAAALGLVALANVLGTWGCGLLGGRLSRKRLLAGLYLLRSAAMALFVWLPLSPATLYPFAFVMGLLWLGTVPLTNGLVSQVFGLRHLSTLFGFVFLGHQLGAFLGVWLGARVFEATHSYDLMWLISMGLGVLAAALHWPIDERPVASTGRASSALSPSLRALP